MSQSNSLQKTISFNVRHSFWRVQIEFGEGGNLAEGQLMAYWQEEWLDADSNQIQVNQNLTDPIKFPLSNVQDLSSFEEINTLLKAELIEFLTPST